ncbi:DNA-binding prophage protein, partial [Salmonella enterica subsp. enterica serovar Senftenberg str. 423984-1]
LTQAACTAYSLKLPIPQQTATPAWRYRSGAAKKHTPETVCVLKIKGECMGKLGGEMKVLAKHCGGSHKTVNDRIHIVQR